MFGNIARSKGMTEVAEKAGVVRQSLYRALSPESRKGRLGHSTGCAFALGGRVRAASRRNGNCRIVPAGAPDWQLREIQRLPAAVAKPEVRRNISEFQAQVAGAAVPNQSS